MPNSQSADGQFPLTLPDGSQRTGAGGTMTARMGEVGAKSV